MDKEKAIEAVASFSIPVHIRITHEHFDVAHEYTQLLENTCNAGAVSFFVGRVRQPSNDPGAPMGSLFMEHYPDMTEKAIARIVKQAIQRWTLLAIRVVHRVGVLQPEEEIVLIGVASAHRADALSACEMLIDYLKNQAPFWKKESVGGEERWIDANPKDEARQARWER